MLLKRFIYFIFIILLLLIFIILPEISLKFSIFLFIFLNILYFFTNIVKAFLFLYSVKSYNYNDYFEKVDLSINDEDLPIYTILLPVRDETHPVLNSLLKSIYELDYPKDKLDIKFVVDENDIKTIKVGKKLLKKFNFDLVIVPDFKVKSKPLSCNYALNFIKGKYLVIFDAEDRPEKYQLKKALKRFNELDEKYICLQASLNFYNKYDNFITYCFSIEYSMWFDFTIRTITKYGTFFPLGGTSNHFKVKELFEIGKWDGYNMTEDAELGVRIAKAGYKIYYLNSITNEECPKTIYAWIKQRTRWIKGFMQTFCEHLFFKKPKTINSNLKFKNIRQLQFFDIITFDIFIMMSFLFFLSIISILINHNMFMKIMDLNLIYLSKLLIFISYFNFFSLILMNYISFITIIIKNKLKFKLLYFIFSLFYWILHYVAGIRAFYYFVKSPFYWSKTKHGKK